jgi:hypothetical protein
MADNTRNPRNPQSGLFNRLTRLFSGPIINRRTQMYRQQRRKQLNKYQNQFQSASGRQFKKSTYNPFDVMQANSIGNQNRAERYMDFDQMEYTPEIASSLDIYADEMTTYSQIQDMLRINCQNDEIKNILSSLYENTLNLQFNLFGWCRTMCKYGDFFLYLDIDEEEGIKTAIGLPPQEVERLEGEDPTNPNYIQFQWNSGGLTFENWQMAHFRILGNDKYSPYGTSVLEPARRIWRQLTLLEDAMMSYRVVRSPERRVFYIDVGNIAPQDVEQYMQRIMTQMKRNQVVDAQTGRVDLRYNPLSVEEDYFMPVRGDSSSKIESLPGGTFTGDIDDVKYLRDKLFSALKVPQSYLSRGEGADEDKSTLAQKDIRFARTIQRLQRSVLSEIEKIGVIHLYTLGFRGDDLVNFSLSLNNPSKIAELQELEHWRTKFDVASGAAEGFFSKRWIATNLFGLTDDEVVRMQREMFFDRKLDAELDAVGQAVEAAAGGAGDMDMGGDDDFDLDGDDDMDLGGDAGADAGDDAGADDDDVLLTTPPGRRSDSTTIGERKPKKGDKTTTKRSKGKVYDVRGNRGKELGARKTSMGRTTGNFAASSSVKNTLPGAQDIGLGGLTNGIMESKDTNYKNEEKKILQTSQTLQRFAESLSKTQKIKLEKTDDGEAQ